MIFCLLCILLFTVWQEAAISDGTLRSTQNSSTGTATYYLWNAKKKLEGVVLSDGTSTAYAYLPGSDLRLVSVNKSGTATLFHWDGVQLREVLQPSEGSPNSPPKAQGGRAINLPTDSNPAQTITSAYITGLPSTWDEVLTVSIPAQDGVEAGAESLLVFLQNHQSSVVGTTETSNPLLSKQLFTYLAYGEPKGTSPESQPLGIGYTGRQHDDTGLMYYRGRYYDQCTGSFIQEDPKRDGWNWYGYTNDPVNMVDPSGYFNWDTFNISDVATGGMRLGEKLATWESLAYMGAGAAAAIAFPATIPFIAGYGVLSGAQQIGSAFANDNNIEAVEQLLGGTLGLAGAKLSRAAHKPNPNSIMGKGVENDAAWSALSVINKVYYEIGQKTLLKTDYKEYAKITDAVERGRKLVDKQKWFKALKPEDYTLGVKAGTLKTGITPLQRSLARSVGSGVTAVNFVPSFQKFTEAFKRICE